MPPGVVLSKGRARPDLRAEKCCCILPPQRVIQDLCREASLVPPPVLKCSVDCFCGQKSGRGQREENTDVTQARMATQWGPRWPEHPVPSSSLHFISAVLQEPDLPQHSSAPPEHQGQRARGPADWQTLKVQIRPPRRRSPSHSSWRSKISPFSWVVNRRQLVL